MSIAELPDTAETDDAGFNRVPPNDTGAEQAVLGAMLVPSPATATQVVDEVSSILRGPEDFYRPAHETIYRAILDMYATSIGKPRIDPITVAAELTKRGELTKVGGASYLHTLVQTVPTAANGAYYAEIVRGRAALRQVIEAGTRMVAQAYAQTEDADQIVQDAMAQVQAAATGTVEAAPPLSVADRWQGFVDELQDGADPNALDTPWPDLNDVIQLKPGQLVTVGAATAGGKSLFGMNLVAHAALKHGKPAMVASMEMSGSELMARLTAAEAGVNLDSLVRRKVTDRDWERIRKISERLATAHHFVLDDSANLSLSKIRARMRWMTARGHAPAIVVADYLQLMTPEGTNKNSNRAQEVADISRGLKLLAVEFQVPVVALAQFNRGAVGRRPLVSDFKESSAIEQDSNIIVLLHRELAEDGTDTGPTSGTVEAIVAKNRNGASGRIVELAFQGHLARLSSMGC
ncbi:replicative DNA helicase [Streptomyces flavofungini]|uniref:replicative DNA helicase n=1 Tax=Streptomyces flavofungini TaxID=68200 RepID=UPI0025B0BD2E|nr:replicative DNA helicase [Streptomyces flavofungini]WJV51818.1 replicative DNA helicase [Streptomyces flavofungini]WJV51833.1 replicative DNA helicase [Streptomyces flavofungini]